MIMSTIDQHHHQHHHHHPMFDAQIDSSARSSITSTNYNNDEPNKSTGSTPITTKPQTARSISKERAHSSSKETQRGRSSEGRSSKEPQSKESKSLTSSCSDGGGLQRDSSREGRRQPSSTAVKDKHVRSSSKDARPADSISRGGKPSTRPSIQSSSTEQDPNSSTPDKRTNRRARSLSRSAGSSGGTNITDPKDAGEKSRATSRERPRSSRRMVANAAENLTVKSNGRRTRSSSRERPSSSRRLSGNATSSTTEDSSVSTSRRGSPRSSSQRRNTLSAENVPSVEVVATSDIRRTTSLIAMNEIVPVSAASKIAEMYGIPAPPPMPEGSPSIRRMRKGNMDSILSPRVGRRKNSSNKTSSSCRNLSQSDHVESRTRKSISSRQLCTEKANSQLEPTLPPKSTSSSSATTGTSTTSRDSSFDESLNFSNGSLSLPRKPASESSETSFSQGTMPLKEPSGPDDPPPKRPQRVRRGRRDPVPLPPRPPPSAPSPPSPSSSVVAAAQHPSKPSSSRFLEFSQAAPSMGLSAPRRRHSPETAKRISVETATTPQPTKGTKFVATPLSKGDFKSLDKANKMAIMDDSLLNFGADEWNCKNLGASKESLGGFSPTLDKRPLDVKIDCLYEKAKTTEVALPVTDTVPPVSDGEGILNNQLDESTCKSYDDLTKNMAKLDKKAKSSTNSLDKLKKKNGAKSSTPTLDSLKKKKVKSSTPSLDKSKMKRQSAMK